MAALFSVRRDPITNEPLLSLNQLSNRRADIEVPNVRTSLTAAIDVAITLPTMKSHTSAITTKAGIAAAMVQESKIAKYAAGFDICAGAGGSGGGGGGNGGGGGGKRRRLLAFVAEVFGTLSTMRARWWRAWRAPWHGRRTTKATCAPFTAAPTWRALPPSSAWRCSVVLRRR